ncbi:hypothetical protein OSTOST_12837, partial [Ostertagia ostertagi]
VYSPSIPSRGYQFCLVCGKHKKFTSLAGHIQDVHKEFTEKWEIQVLVHTGRGMLERTKKASVDFTRIPEPRTDREWDTFWSDMWCSASVLWQTIPEYNANNWNSWIKQDRLSRGFYFFFIGVYMRNSRMFNRYLFF